MGSLLIKKVWLDDAPVDVFIKGNLIEEVRPGLNIQADKIIDGSGKAAIPGFVNTHTHAAMTLFRGYGDDMALLPWLEQKIWPNEANLTDEDVYWGSKLACLEMIKSGTTTFLDMYQRPESTALAVSEMGIRGILSEVFFDHFKPEAAERCKENMKKHAALQDKHGARVKYSLGPHAIYTVSGALLQWIHNYASEHDMLIHLHLAETVEEVNNSIRYTGLSPVRYLDKLGILSPRLLLAHALYVDREEIKMIAGHGVKVAHNPASNMKLASGMQFLFDEMKEAGIDVGIGTDGCSSSNNLDMIEAMKLASLSGKAWRKNPEAHPAGEMFEAATLTGAKIAGLNAGKIEKGKLADLCLIDLKMPAFTPNFNFISNLVYAANGSCVDTLICDGKILMENKIVPGEDEIMERAARTAYDLMSR